MWFVHDMLAVNRCKQTPRVVSCNATHLPQSCTLPTLIIKEFHFRYESSLGFWTQFLQLACRQHPGVVHAAASLPWVLLLFAARLKTLSPAVTGLRSNAYLIGKLRDKGGVISMAIKWTLVSSLPTSPYMVKGHSGSWRYTVYDHAQIWSSEVSAQTKMPKYGHTWFYCKSELSELHLTSDIEPEERSHIYLSLIIQRIVYERV